MFKLFCLFPKEPHEINAYICPQKTKGCQPKDGCAEIIPCEPVRIMPTKELLLRLFSSHRDFSPFSYFYY